MDFFYAEDIAKVARAIARERRKREIVPVVELMADFAKADWVKLKMLKRL